jgi:hypothetical protein
VVSNVCLIKYFHANLYQLAKQLKRTATKTTTMTRVSLSSLLSRIREARRRKRLLVILLLVRKRVERLALETPPQRLRLSDKLVLGKQRLIGRLLMLLLLLFSTSMPMSIRLLHPMFPLPVRKERVVLRL